MRGFTIAESIYYVAGLFLTLINITYVALLLYIYSHRPINKLLFAKCLGFMEKLFKLRSVRARSRL